MKKTLLGLVALLSFGLASAQTISFDKTVHDYGKVAHGADGHTYFTITNTGKEPLILSDVKPACGCTTPEWSKDPILPGKSTKIKVGYNTNLNGAFSKPIEVFSNDAQNPRSVLIIKGEIIGAAGQQLEVAPMKAQAAQAPAMQSRKAAPAKKAALKSATPVALEAKK
ncbi:DUF1573 domain-containing protein [Soonwooa purpurea]